MATIQITEIQKILANRGEKESYHDGFFLEIRFDDPSRTVSSRPVDEELKNKVITADSPFGIVTIQFDEYGQLKLLDIS